MQDRDYLELVAIKPSRIIIIIYAIAKQVFYSFLIEGYYWIPRLIASIAMITIVFVLTGNKKLSNRELSILVPLSTAIIEIILCTVIEGDRLTYIFLIGCALFSLMYADALGLFIMLVLSNSFLAIVVFGLGFSLIGVNYTASDELFNFVGVIIVDILIFLIGKYSIKDLTRFGNLGQTFNAIIDTTPNFIAVVNDKAKVEYISESLARWLGIGKKEYAVDLPFIDLFSSSELKLLFGELMRRDGYVEEMFQTVIGGSIHWFMLRSVTMGNSRRARFFEWEDVTPIIDAQKVAEAAARAKSEFLARMSHEIRTPMNAIIGITELILRDEVHPNTYEHAINIKSAGKNLLSIINDILDYSKIDSGMMEITPAEYEVESLINDVINLIRIKSMEKSLFFIVNIDSTMPRKLVGDEVRIRQVIINLLGNAVKYTNEGFISMTVNRIINDDDTMMLCIEIADSGVGIRPEDMGKLFGYFIQIDQAGNKEVQGTGLGLAISKNLCVAMGGDIHVQSEYGKGSVFTVEIPQKISSHERFASVDQPQNKSVLLYEPREIYADSVERSIESLGVKCVRARTSQDFWDALPVCECEFVFMSSFLIEEAKKIMDSAKSSLKLVLLTEYGEVIAKKDIRTIAMPAQSMSIANILNCAIDNAGYGEGSYFNITFSAPDARVLIVDDITTNLKVAEGLMAPYNMKIDTCLSGEAAIEMVKNTKYDLIFMDHMMPGMDGVETSRRIRELDDGYCAEVPIIALTANAISGAKDMFLKIGMNDFLAKPVEIIKLNQILESWIPDSKRKTQTVKNPQDTVESEEDNQIRTLLEKSGLDTSLGISATGGRFMNYIKTLIMFSKDCKEKIVQIEDSKDNDLRLYITNVHALKSALYSIGSKGMSRFAADLEAAGRDGKTDFINKNTYEFINRLKILLEAIDKMESNMWDNDSGTDQIDQSTLISLKEAFEKMDAQLLGSIINGLRAMRLDKATNEYIESIYQSFLMFEYDTAQTVIDKMMAGVNI